MRRPIILASLVLGLANVAFAPVSAVAADFTAFRAACTKGGAFLIGEVPEGKNAQPVLDALCPCLEAGFAGYSQPEINALEADLRTGTNDEAKATYPAYQELQIKATGYWARALARRPSWRPLPPKVSDTVRSSCRGRPLLFGPAAVRLRAMKTAVAIIVVSIICC